MAGTEAVVTQLGINKIQASVVNGTPVVLNQAGAGINAYTPSINQTALQNEAIRVPIQNYTVVTGQLDTFQIVVTFESNTPFTAKEFGIFVDDGTLFAVWSAPGYIGIPISSPSLTVITFQVKLNPDATITIIEANPDFIYVVEPFLDILSAYDFQTAASLANVTANLALMGIQLLDNKAITLDNQYKIKYLTDSGQVTIPGV